MHFFYTYWNWMLWNSTAKTADNWPLRLFF